VISRFWGVGVVWGCIVVGVVRVVACGCVCRLLHVGCALGCVWCRNRVSRVGLCVAYLVPEYVVEALVPGDIRLACELHKQFNEGCVSAAVLGEEVVACCH
jgi:hypothetical protein